MRSVVAIRLSLKTPGGGHFEWNSKPARFPPDAQLSGIMFHGAFDIFLLRELKMKYAAIIKIHKKVGISIIAIAPA